MTQFNQELITKARKGEIAILNDGSVGELRELLKEIWPQDDVDSNGLLKYYYQSKVDPSYWCGSEVCDWPTHSAKDFFMPDTNKLNVSPQKKFSDIVDKEADNGKSIRTYKVTRQQMKEVYLNHRGEHVTILQVVGSWFGLFEEEVIINNSQLKDLLDCFSEPYPDILRSTFPEYFFIPEGEPVLVRQEDGQDWNILISNGTGGAYTKGRLYGFSDTFKQIIPFTKNPPK